MNNDFLVDEWLEIACEEYKVAKHLYDTLIPRPLEIICYHCQQSAEKSLKGYMCANDIDTPKAHLGQICLQCAEIDRSFLEYQKECELLETYATQTRYPGRTEVDDSDAKHALLQTLNIYNFVSKKLGLD